MPVGFFSKVELAVVPPVARVPKCGACRLDRGCNSPKMPAFGRGKRQVLVVGEAPGRVEDERGRPFVGDAGQRLRRHLRRLGIDLDRDCWVTNSLICRPPANDTPTGRQIDYCRANLNNTILDYRPEVIILLGGVAVQSLIGRLWHEKLDSITRWVGWRIPSQELNAWVCPTYHPSFVMRLDRGVGQPDPAADLIFTNHLRQAFALEGRPYDKVPDCQKDCRYFLDQEEAAEALRAMIRGGDGPLAFDYETNMLKPDSSRAKVAACAVSDGSAALAFCWGGAPVKVVRELLKSGRRLIAANAKFEDRWTRKEFGFGLKNLYWDTVLAAHVLDNRPRISGVKFQAFVRLGQPSYDRHVRPYLESRHHGGYAENRVFQAPKPDLLTYNAMDALVEWKIYESQRKEFGL